MRTGRWWILAVILVGWCCRSPVGAAEDPSVLRLGLDLRTLTTADPEDIKVAFTVWVEDLAKQLELDLAIDARIFNEPNELVESLRHEDVDLLVVNTLTFLDVRTSIPLDPVLVIQHSDGVGQEYALIVHRKRQSAGLAGLRGRRVAMQGGGIGDIPRVWLDVLLSRQGLPPASRFFGSLRSKVEPSKCVLPVFFEEADAAVVGVATLDTMVELNPQLGRELVVIERSEPLVETIACFRRSYRNAKVRSLFFEKAFKLDEYPAGRQIMTLYRVRQMLLFRDEYLDGIRSLWTDRSSTAGKDDR